jgi:hypothetical protein
MSDPKSGPDDASTKPDPQTDQPAKPGMDQLPKAKQLTFVQQLALWVLIIIVGALFGMSGSLQVIQGGDHSHGGIPDAEVNSLMAIDRKLERDTERPMTLRDPYDPTQDLNRTYRDYVKVARRAEDDGLMPSGEALEKLVDDFLDEPLGPGRTVRSALNEYKGGENEVTRAELRRRTAVREGYTAFLRRQIVTPAVPLAVADGLSMLRDDKVQVDEAVIDATTLLKPVAEDDPEIQTTYEKLRAQRFTKPESETLTVAYADVEALKKQQTISDADAQAYYDAHKNDPDFQKPKAAPIPVPLQPAPPKPEMEPKALDEVKATIVDRLQTERALKVAKDAANALDADAEALENQKDNASFKEAAAKKGLVVKEGVTVEPPAQSMGPRMLALAGLGSMRDLAGLFSHDKEAGFISRALPIDGPPATFAVLRLEARTEAGFKPLAEVKPEVMKILQGQRAYKDFVAKAQAAREAAQKVGLAAYLATPEAQAVWGTTVKPTQNTLRPSDSLSTPPAELGQPSPESRIAASLAMPDHPVALVEAGDISAELPRAKLVQARAYEPGKSADDVAKRGDAAESYRRALQNYRWRLFYPELQRIQEQK